MMRAHRPARQVAALLVAGLLLAACGRATPSTTAAQADDQGVTVVATTTVLGELLTRVVGDAGTVEVLTPPGQDPHGFAPSARQAEAVRAADLVVAFGLGLEEGMQDALAAAEADGVEVVHVAEAVDPLPFTGGTGEADEGDDEEEHDLDDGHGHAADPHVWFDPTRMAEGVGVVAAVLAELAPGHDWSARAGAVAEDLAELDDEVRDLLAPIPDRCRRLVTSHDSLGYLAARYDLEVIGTVIPGSSSQAAPSAQDFAALADLLREVPVPAIFAETTSSTDLAETLAAEVGRDIAVVELHTGSLGPPGSGADTYEGMLRIDAERIADALADC